VLVAGISKELVAKGLSADQWVQQVAKVVGGGGGGRPDMAQAGGKDPSKLPEALELARQTMAQWLAQ
jgi:alanyl-tRNA synthetase